MLESNSLEENIGNTGLPVYMKTILGVGLSMACMGIGVYVKYLVSPTFLNSSTAHQKALQERYIKTEFSKEKGSFYMSFRSLDTVPVTHTLIAFTSLACHVCSTFHRVTFEKIKSSALYTSGALRVIFVEYPGDRLSFFASGYVWASKDPINARERLMATQDLWTVRDHNDISSHKVEKEQLKKVQAILKTRHTLSQKALKVLFEKKMEAHKVFGIKDIPFFVLYTPNAPKDQRIKTRIGEVEWNEFCSWLGIP